MRKQWKYWQTLFSEAPKSLQMVTAAMKLKDTCSLEEWLWQRRQCIKKQRHHFADKGTYSQSYGFSNSHVWMWLFDYKEGWVPKNWCFKLWCWRRLLRVPWTAKGNQPWIFIGRTDAEAESSNTLATWCKETTTGKDPDAGKEWGQEEKRATEDEIVGWHHWLDGHEFEQTLGDSKGQGSLACWSPWDHKESDTT